MSDVAVLFYVRKVFLVFYFKDTIVEEKIPLIGNVEECLQDQLLDV